MLLLYPHSYTTMIMIKTSNYTMNRIKYDSHMYINAQIFYINKACLQFDAFRITAILIENAIKSKYNWKSAYHSRVFYTRAKNIWTGTFIYPINVQPSFPARMYQSENSLRRNIFKNHAGYGKRSIGPKQKKKIILFITSNILQIFPSQNFDFAIIFALLNPSPPFPLRYNSSYNFHY